MYVVIVYSNLLDFFRFSFHKFEITYRHWSTASLFFLIFVHYILGSGTSYLERIILNYLFDAF